VPFLVGTCLRENKIIQHADLFFMEFQKIFRHHIAPELRRQQIKRTAGNRKTQDLNLVKSIFEKISFQLWQLIILSWLPQKMKDIGSEV